ncbi:hypothetical protein A2662_01870 [Candidatus Giovannonibacteria bacterium RIFCSPHIGHO2_01_FULL_45_33]|uniref:Uncharacterized protein n=1 Tax=Candidatus Giovannonibacteria bacterium RIFCSPLOWO2_01_FULL_45_34 TaxID=1798351 RepID=A0A1F5WZJ3_9BACT|nr:MAG: hypothetical protein A2662_01870 [Candidatus Giovannonibacteria bacterium RIFCSPHIGHO2_01_FULL_45_33]OGF69045.1 MAG: hypothetical protein A3C73_00780 [Candidatus Giovannonibacteria bacterium RIFCSPHIGHO2_02_FULL_44_11]OGF81039.1 MAG: hypothetical protein A2930_03210 [Candidatus Giovannonibacteria bacterium RIFCSPLOWO2_01_FULL_45_34]
MLNRFSNRTYLLIATAMIAVFAGILFLMGQVPICKCGYIKLWHGITYSSENSQHLTDWYTFSHIIHGFVFYWISRIIGKKFGWPVALSFLLALFAEISWEIFENTDFIINRYREVTISLDYYGDSVINSVFDVLSMIWGFWLARKLPVWVTILLIIIMELYVGFMIRDNLTLNIVMLVWPLEAIKNWQTGG